MAINASILAAFERMWQHALLKFSEQSNTNHNHDDTYYTEVEIDTMLSSKADSNHNHDGLYAAIDSVSTALDEAKSYTDTKTVNLITSSNVDAKISTYDTTHNTATDTHNDIRALITDLTTKLNNFLDVDDTTSDQLSEVLTLIENNKGTLDSLTTSKVNVSDIVNNLTTNTSDKVLSAAQGVAIKNLIDALQAELDSHTHIIADVDGLQSALDEKADSSHGTHVTYSTDAPIMDGVANVGTASTVSRSDHIHPTDTSRASQKDLDTLAGVVAGKADSSHIHAISEVANLQTALENKANISHTHSKSDVGLDNVENKSSATIRSEITKANVVDALGYEPPVTDTTYSAITDDEIDEICGNTIAMYLNSISSEGVSF